VFNPTLLITHNILHTYVLWFCYGYGNIYVNISVFPARCQVTLPLQLLKI